MDIWTDRGIVHPRKSRRSRRAIRLASAARTIPLLRVPPLGEEALKVFAADSNLAPCERAQQRRGQTR